MTDYPHAAGFAAMTDILELIDGAIDDHMSADAMRWTPEGPTGEPATADRWIVSLPFQEPRHLPATSAPFTFVVPVGEFTPTAGRFIYEPAPLGEPVGLPGVQVHVSDAVPAGHVYVIDPQLFLVDPQGREADLTQFVSAIVFSSMTTGNVYIEVERSLDRRGRLRRMHTMYGRRVRCRRRRG